MPGIREYRVLMLAGPLPFSMDWRHNSGGMDGIFWYTFAHKDPTQWDERQPGHFELRPDPVKMTQLLAGARVAAKRTAAGWEIHIGEPATTWYAIEIQR